MRQGRTEAASGGFQCGHFFAASGASRSRSFRLGLQNLFHCVNLRLRDKQTDFVKSARRLGAAAVMSHRLAPNVEFKPAGDTAALLGPKPHRVSGHSDDLSGLKRVIEPFAVNDVRLGRASRGGFGCWLHPRIQARRWRKITRKISRFLRALPGLLVARKAGAALTGSAPADKSQNERSETSGADWRSDATGFYE